MTDPKFDAIRELVNAMDHEEWTWPLHSKIDAAEAAYVDKSIRLEVFEHASKSAGGEINSLRARVAEMEATIKRDREYRR